MIFVSLTCVLSRSSGDDLTTLRIDWALFGLISFDGDIFFFIFNGFLRFLNLFLLKSFLLNPLDVRFKWDQWQEEKCEKAEDKAH